MTRGMAVVCLAVFAAVFAAHFGWQTWQDARIASHWIAVGAGVRPGAWERYIERGDAWLGYAYALAVAFTAFALVLIVRQRRRDAGGLVGGLTLLGTLYAAGCFLVGCCGSPMLAVYLSLFGASFLGLVKPIVAGITTLSVAAGVVALVRRARRPCCPAPSEAPVARGA